MIRISITSIKEVDPNRDFRLHDEQERIEIEVREEFQRLQEQYHTQTIVTGESI